MYVFIIYLCMYLLCIYFYIMFVFKYLFIYVCRMYKSCTYDTNKSRYPCSMCMSQKSSLSSVEGQDHEYRTEPNMKRVYRRMFNQPRNVQQEIATTYSLHLVEVSLYIKTMIYSY